MLFGNIVTRISKMGIALSVVTTLTLVSCGGGGGSSSNSPTPAEIAAITPAQIATYTGSQIIALGTNFQYLSDAALGALSATHVFNVTSAQILVLTPAQVRLLGSTAGGVTSTSKIGALHLLTWTTLVSDPLQVAAITPAEISTMVSPSGGIVQWIAALGTNIQYLNDAALGALSQAQVININSAQILVLTPAQVRLLGSTVGGVTSTSKIGALHLLTWTTLVSDPLQVAAITPAEITTMVSPSGGIVQWIAALGTNIQYLNDAALGALSQAQVININSAQILVLTPAQVRLLGSTVGGVTSTSKIGALLLLTWTTLVSDPLQVAAITPAEITTMVSPSGGIVQWIAALGTNIQYLNDAALGALSQAQVININSAQILVLTPAQVRLLGSTVGGVTSTSKIGALHLLTWTTLVSDPLQVAAITPAEITTMVSPSGGIVQWIAALGTNIQYLSDAALGALSASQKAAITAAQKAVLSAAQHTACGC